MNAAPVLVAKGLVRDFRSSRGGWRAPAFRAVDDVSLAVEEGECLGILGESGSGKSTLGRMLLGLVRPTDGHVSVAGQDLGALPARRLRALRSKMALVQQDPMAALDPRMRVGRQVAEPMVIHRVPKARHAQRLEEALAMTGLTPELAARYPHQLSGGQRQRAVIARALILRPRLVVLDEPVSALDVSVQAQILAMLSRLRGETGAAFVFISHDIRVVRQLADRVMVMHRGRVVEEGPAADLVDSPREAYTRDLVRAVPLIPGEAAPAAKGAWP